MEKFSALTSCVFLFMDLVIQPILVELLPWNLLCVIHDIKQQLKQIETVTLELGLICKSLLMYIVRQQWCLIYQYNECSRFSQHIYRLNEWVLLGVTLPWIRK
jgi:hypothetical protein